MFNGPWEPKSRNEKLIAAALRNRGYECLEAYYDSAYGGWFCYYQPEPDCSECIDDCENITQLLEAIADLPVVAASVAYVKRRLRGGKRMQELIVWCIVIAAIGVVVIGASAIVLAAFSLSIFVVLKLLGLYAEFRAFLASRSLRKSAVQIIGEKEGEWP